MRVRWLAMALLVLGGGARVDAKPRTIDLKDPFRPRRPMSDLKNPFSLASAAPSPSSTAMHVGVQVSPMTRELRRFFGAPPTSGVLVTQIDTSGPAAAAGVRVGDVIVEIDNVRIGSDPQPVLDAVADAWVGTQLHVTVVRNRARLVLRSSGTTRPSPVANQDPDAVISPDDRLFSSGRSSGHPSLDYYEEDPDGIIAPYVYHDTDGILAPLGDTDTTTRTPSPGELERLRLRLRNLERRLGALESQKGR
jgi:membrane-associated protease RseP (regulator of RpoE activity)